MLNHKYQKYSHFIFFLLICFSTFSCSKKQKNYTSIDVRLLWLNQAQFAGIYVAKEKGFFKENNLEVNVIPGGPGINPVRMVASGSEDIGICSASDIILAREKNIPIRCLSVIVPENPTCFFSKSSSGIKTVQDFIGKKIGVKIGFELEYYLTAMLNNANVDENQIKRIPIQFDMTPFFNDEIDVWCGYRINEPNIARSQGIEVNEIFPSDYGVNVSGDVIFTTEKFFNSNKDLCMKFVNSVCKGWKFAKNNRTESVEITLKYNDKGDIKHESAMLNIILELINPIKRGNFFDQDVKMWSEMINFLKKYDVINESVDPTSCFWSIK